jgi:hypothetical protein
MRKSSSILLLGFLLLSVSGTSAQVIGWIQNDDGETGTVAGRLRQNDTCGVVFTPPTACKLLGAAFNFGYTGDAQVFVSHMAANYNPDAYVDCHVEGVPGPRPIGAFWISPLPSYTFPVGWDTIVFANYGYTPDMLNVGTDLFYIGYRLLGGPVNLFDPAISLDQGDTPPYQSLMYLYNPGSPNTNEHGWWGYGYDVLIRAEILMYGDPPPTISGLVDRSDTYLPGPYPISAFINDQGPGGGQGQVTAAQLHYTIMNSPNWTVVNMTHLSDSTYLADIPAQPPYTIIDYYVEAHDNAGHVTISPSGGGFRFSYLQPTPGANILLVNDNATEGQTFYMTALQAGGYTYDLWRLNPGQQDDQGYPGTDVLNHNIYSTVLWFTGTANPGSLPDNDANLATDPVALYMNSGGNFFLSSSDYLGGAFNPDVWTEFLSTPPGTFMHDYLHVGSGWSDSHIGPSGESQDTVYYGLAGDPVSGNFTTPFQDYPSPNYNDVCYPVTNSGAVTCFRTQIDAESAGIRYAGNYKMVFLPWILEACPNETTGRGILYSVISYFTSAPPIFDVALTPLNPPIQIPAHGGSFQFNAGVTRLIGPQAPYSVWTRIKNPNGTYTLPLLGPVTINTPVGVTITRMRNQNVPGSWVSGLYTYLGYINTTYSYPAADSSSFTFVKLTTGSGPYVWETTCTGEPFPGEPSVIASLPSGLELGVSPNPFNPTTSFSYQLQASSYVSLKVYETTGRLVATLVAGRQEAGSHEATFDGARLASGVYLYTFKAGEYSATGKMVLLK